MTDSLKSQLINSRLEEIAAREKVIRDLRELQMGSRTTRLFCEKELGYTPLETRSILAVLGYVLLTEALASNDAPTQSRIDRLREWRRARASREGVPAYRVLSNRTLLDVASGAPKTTESLRELKGFGAKRTETYGPELIALLNS